MNPYQTYQRTSIQTADPCQVIILLYEGALRNLNSAIAQIDEDRVEKNWSTLLTKTLDIINFLTNSLDYSKGAEIAQNLANLYDYIRDIINNANIKQEVEPLREARALLNTILEGWRGISEGNATPTDSEEEKGAKETMPPNSPIQMMMQDKLNAYQTSPLPQATYTV